MIEMLKNFLLKVNITEFPNTGSGYWALESDQIGGIRQNVDNNLKGTKRAIQIKCSKFWVYGSKTNWNHLIYVSFGNILELIDEYVPGPRIDSSLLYESPYIPYQEDKLLFQVVEYSITLNCIYYLDELPPPTPTPTPSQPFSFSNQFSSSDKFTQSLTLTESATFTKSSVFSESKKFDPSSLFTNSYNFTLSNKFSSSSLFSNSNKFTESNKFVPSSLFTKSNNFESSGYFTNSFKFTKTDYFTKTGEFSKTNDLTKSSQFTNSAHFSSSFDFTNSKQFSNSKSFTSTDYFTKTDLFSISTDFTRSIKFTNSNEFTKSKDFSNSFHFTASEHFTETDYFSKTDHFSNTDQFSISADFTSSIKFTNSNEFTKSKDFSNTVHFTTSIHFTLTDHFSNTNYFSNTDKFSISTHFTNSFEFTNTNKFTNSNSFSPTNHFSNSEHFSSSFYFTNSEQFSKTHEFSPSAILDDPTRYSCLVSHENETHILYDRCYFIGSAATSNQIGISLIRSVFENFINESDGGSIYILDGSVYFNNSEFINCISLNGCGGAIYINNSIDIKNDVVFDNLTFKNCQATFGGALVFYSVSDLSNASIINCKFYSNKITGIDSNKKSEFFGGSAAFLCAKNILVNESKFVGNKGNSGALKIYNKFNKINSFNLLQNNKNSIVVSNCNFDLNDASKSSIYYVNGKDGSMIDIINCIFNSKLNKNSGFIDGKEWNIHYPKVSIKSCSFQQKEKSNFKVSLLILLSTFVVLFVIIVFVIKNNEQIKFLS